MMSMRLIYTVAVGAILVVFGEHIVMDKSTTVVDLTLTTVDENYYHVHGLSRTCRTCQGNTYLANICGPDDTHSDCRPCRPGSYQPGFPDSHVELSCVVNHCGECPTGLVLTQCLMPQRKKVCCEEEQTTKCQQIFHGAGDLDQPEESLSTHSPATSTSTRVSHQDQSEESPSKPAPATSASARPSHQDPPEESLSTPTPATSASTRASDLDQPEENLSTSTLATSDSTHAGEQNQPKESLGTPTNATSASTRGGDIDPPEEIMSTPSPTTSALTRAGDLDLPEEIISKPAPATSVSTTGMTPLESTKIAVTTTATSEVTTEKDHYSSSSIELSSIIAIIIGVLSCIAFMSICILRKWCRSQRRNSYTREFSNPVFNRDSESDFDADDGYNSVGSNA